MPPPQHSNQGDISLSDRHQHKSSNFLASSSSSDADGAAPTVVRETSSGIEPPRMIPAAGTETRPHHQQHPNQKMNPNAASNSPIFASDVGNNNNNAKPSSSAGSPSVLDPGMPPNSSTNVKSGSSGRKRSRPEWIRDSSSTIFPSPPEAHQMLLKKRKRQQLGSDTVTEAINSSASSSVFEGSNAFTPLDTLAQLSTRQRQKNSDAGSSVKATAAATTSTTPSPKKQLSTTATADGNDISTTDLSRSNLIRPPRIDTSPQPAARAKSKSSVPLSDSGNLHSNWKGSASFLGLVNNSGDLPTPLPKLPSFLPSPLAPAPNSSMQTSPSRISTRNVPSEAFSLPLEKVEHPSSNSSVSTDYHPSASSYGTLKRMTDTASMSDGTVLSDQSSSTRSSSSSSPPLEHPMGELLPSLNQQMRLVYSQLLEAKRIPVRSTDAMQVQFKKFKVLTRKVSNYVQRILEKHPDSMFGISMAPNVEEILALIFSFLPLAQVMNMRYVCKHWASAVRNPLSVSEFTPHLLLKHHPGFSHSFISSGNVQSSKNLDSMVEKYYYYYGTNRAPSLTRFYVYNMKFLHWLKAQNYVFPNVKRVLVRHMLYISTAAEFLRQLFPNMNHLTAHNNAGYGTDILGLSFIARNFPSIETVDIENLQAVDNDDDAFKLPKLQYLCLRHLEKKKLHSLFENSRLLTELHITHFNRPVLFDSSLQDKIPPCLTKISCRGDFTACFNFLGIFSKLRNQLTTVHVEYRKGIPSPQDLQTADNATSVPPAKEGDMDRREEDIFVQVMPLIRNNALTALNIVPFMEHRNAKHSGITFRKHAAEIISLPIANSIRSISMELNQSDRFIKRIAPQLEELFLIRSPINKIEKVILSMQNLRVLRMNVTASMGLDFSSLKNLSALELNIYKFKCPSVRIRSVSLKSLVVTGKFYGIDVKSSSLKRLLIEPHSSIEQLDHVKLKTPSLKRLSAPMRVSVRDLKITSEMKHLNLEQFTVTQSAVIDMEECTKLVASEDVVRLLSSNSFIEHIESLELSSSGLQSLSEKSRNAKTPRLTSIPTSPHQLLSLFENLTAVHLNGLGRRYSSMMKASSSMTKGRDNVQICPRVHTLKITNYFSDYDILWMQFPNISSLSLEYTEDPSVHGALVFDIPSHAWSQLQSFSVQGDEHITSDSVQLFVQERMHSLEDVHILETMHSENFSHFTLPSSDTLNCLEMHGPLDLSAGSEWPSLKQLHLEDSAFIVNEVNVEYTKVLEQQLSRMGAKVLRMLSVGCFFVTNEALYSFVHKMLLLYPHLEMLRMGIRSEHHVPELYEHLQPMCAKRGCTLELDW